MAHFLFSCLIQKKCDVYLAFDVYFSDVAATDDPPRPTFDSVLSRDMAGYMPARADFMEVRGYMCALLYSVCVLRYPVNMNK